MIRSQINKYNSCSSCHRLRLSIKRYSHNLPICITASIGLSSVLHPHQHSIGYMGDDFYRSEDPTNSIKALKEEATEKNLEKLNNKI